MNVNHLDARAVGQPGGLYESAGNGLLQAMMAYAQSKDNQRRGERDMRREERSSQRDQYRQALDDAQRLGVRPSAEQSGWLAPENQAGIQAALAQHQERKQAQQAAALRQRLADIEAGVMMPSQTNEAFYANGLREVPANLAAEWAAQSRGEASRQAAGEAAAIKNNLLQAQAELMTQKAMGGGTSPRGAGGGLSSADLAALRERAQRYADAQGWTTYDYDENGKPFNRQVNPNDPEAYRKIMELEASLGLPGANEVLEFDAQRRSAPPDGPPAPVTGMRDKPMLDPEAQRMVDDMLAKRAAKRSIVPARVPAQVTPMTNDEIYADDPVVPSRAGSRSASQAWMRNPSQDGLPAELLQPADVDRLLRARSDRVQLLDLLD